jgi:PAS domain-containing protein
MRLHLASHCCAAIGLFSGARRAQDRFSVMTEPVYANRKSFSPPAFASIRSLADAAFNAVFDSSAEALLVIDSSGAIHRINKRGRELLRLKDSFAPRRKNFLGLLPITVAERLKSLWSHTAPPKLHGLDILLSNGQRVRLSHRGVLPHSHYILLCVEEAAHLNRAEAKSRHLEAELRSTLESLQVGVIISDHTGRLRFHNARFEHLFGLSSAAIHEAAYVDALHKSIASRFREPNVLSEPWRAFQDGVEKSGRDELQLLRPAKRPR